MTKPDLDHLTDAQFEELARRRIEQGFTIEGLSLLQHARETRVERARRFVQRDRALHREIAAEAMADERREYREKAERERQQAEARTLDLRRRSAEASREAERAFAIEDAAHRRLNETAIQVLKDAARTNEQTVKKLQYLTEDMDYNLEQAFRKIYKPSAPNPVWQKQWDQTMAELSKPRFRDENNQGK